MKTHLKKTTDELTPAEAATILGIGQTTVYRYMRRNLIPFVKRGRQFFLKKSAVFRAKAAMNLPGDWHKNVKYAIEDYFVVRKPLPENTFKGLTESVAQQMPADIKINKPEELFQIALKLKSLGQIDLAKSAAAAAITL